MAYYGNQPIAGETNSFKVLDDISSYTKTFDGSSAAVVSTSDDTLTFYDHRFIQGQRVTYGKGSGGTVVTGLTDATVYYVIRQDKDTIQLATSASNAATLTAIDLTGVGGGTVHELTVAFDGTNTKFKATTGGGTHIKLTRPGQLMISMNGVVQEPQNNTPTNGFGIESNNVIVFSTAPTVLDTFWGHYLTSNLSSWEMSDNKIDNFTGNGSTTTYTLSKTPANADNILVTIDGVTQYPSDSTTTRSYTLDESVVTFTSAPTINSAIAVRHIGYAGASGGGSGGGGVTGFYGRTGNVKLIRSDLQNTDINLKNLTGVAATFTGNVSIGGTLTYTDVTNIDSIGIVTAQSGVHFGIGATSGKFEAATGITTFSTSVGIADSIHHVGNTDTSIRFPADDTFTVETAGSEALRIKSDGSVGIGTVTPETNFRLTVQGDLSLGEKSGTDNTYIDQKQNGDLHIINSGRAANGSAVNITGGAGGIGINRYNTIAGDTTYHRDFTVYNGKSTKVLMVDGSSSQVGIGTDNPARKVEIFDTAATVLQLNSTNTGGTSLRIQNSGTDKMYMGLAGDFIVGQGSNVTDSAIRASGALLFASGGGTERLRIKSDGDVEVATTTATSPAYLRFNSNRSNADDALGGIQGIWNGNSVAGITFKTGADTSNKDDGRIQFITYGGGSAATRMMILENGKVGINTEIPESPLEILGDSTIGDAKITFNRAPTAGNDGVIGELFFQNATDSVALISVKRESAADDAYIQFATQKTGGGVAERLRIDSDGAVNIGSNPAQATGTNTQNAVLTVKGYPSNETSAAILALVRGNNTTSTAADHTMGRIVFSDKQAGEYAFIEGEAEANGAVGDTPGRLVFSTAPDGTSAPTEKLRILSNGHVAIGDDIANDTGMFKVIAADGQSDDQYVAQFKNLEATQHRNWGLLVTAGSSSTDESLRVRNSAQNRDHLLIMGDGVKVTQSRGGNYAKTYEFNYNDGAPGGVQTVSLATVANYGSTTSAVAEVTYVGVYGTANHYIYSGKWICGVRRQNNDSGWNSTAEETANGGNQSEASLDIGWDSGVLKATTVGPWMGWTVNVRITVLNANITVNV